MRVHALARLPEGLGGGGVPVASRRRPGGRGEGVGCAPRRWTRGGIGAPGQVRHYRVNIIIITYSSRGRLGLLGTRRFYTMGCHLSVPIREQIYCLIGTLSSSTRHSQ